MNYLVCLLYFVHLFVSPACMPVLLSMYAEVPWILLFLCCMLAVEMQLRYCLPCLRASAKVVQSGFMVLALRLWLDDSFGKTEQWANTLRSLLNKTSA